MTRGESVSLSAAKRNREIIFLVLKEKNSEEGISNNRVAEQLHSRGVRSSRGGKLTATSVKRYLDQAKVLERFHKQD